MHTDIVAKMDSDLLEVEEEVEDAEYWKVLTAVSTPPVVVLSVMREVMFEIGSYQKEVDIAVFTAVGRLGHSIEEQSLIRSMLAVQIEEVGHGTLARLDSIALGGGASKPIARRPSPAAQALIGTVRHLGEREHPLCHLGFVYFFEKFTTTMTGKIAPTLQRARYPEDRLHFMKLHAEEDIRHADMLANVIEECVKRYDDAESHIQHGFDSFRIVYPHPVWNSAFQRAIPRA